MLASDTLPLKILLLDKYWSLELLGRRRFQLIKCERNAKIFKLLYTSLGPETCIYGSNDFF